MTSQPQWENVSGMTKSDLVWGMLKLEVQLAYCILANKYHEIEMVPDAWVHWCILLCWINHVRIPRYLPKSFYPKLVSYAVSFPYIHSFFLLFSSKFNRGRFCLFLFFFSFLLYCPILQCRGWFTLKLPQNKFQMWRAWPRHSFCGRQKQVWFLSQLLSHASTLKRSGSKEKKDRNPKPHWEKTVIDLSLLPTKTQNIHKQNKIFTLKPRSVWKFYSFYFILWHSLHDWIGTKLRVRNLFKSNGNVHF